ncbi:MAG: glycosyltransferase, partial [Alphaproteobacteria bacterium]
MRLSIVIPVLNERAALPATLAALAPMRGRGVDVIVADGGSDDGTPILAAAAADRVLAAPRGR